jgi:site-specific DNA recombinase
VAGEGVGVADGAACDPEAQPGREAAGAGGRGPKQRPSYGYMYVRPAPTAKVDHVALDTVAVEIAREAARRILSDETGKITVATEAARLTREGVPSPSDRRAQLYGRPVKGGPWTAKTLKHILCSEAALGYLMHDGRPVAGADSGAVVGSRDS